MSQYYHSDLVEKLIEQHRETIVARIREFARKDTYKFNKIEYGEIINLLKVKLSKLIIASLPATLTGQQISSSLTDILAYRHDVYLLKCAPNRLIIKHKNKLCKAIHELGKPKYCLDKQAQTILLELLEPQLLQEIRSQIILLEKSLPGIPSILYSILQQILGNTSKDLYQRLDLLLLEKSPDSLIIKYGFLINIIVKKNCHNAYQRKEAQQVVQEKLLKNVRDKKWCCTYTGRNGASFETYFSTVIKREVFKYLRREAKCSFYRLNSLDKVHVNYDVMNAFQYRSDFQLHLKRLCIYLESIKKDARKEELCLRVIYGIPLTTSQIRCLYPDCPKPLLKELLKSFGKKVPFENRKPTKRQLYQQMNDFLYQLEQSDEPTSSGNLRKWFKRRKEKLWSTIFEESIEVKQMDKEYIEILDWYFEILLHEYFNLNDKISYVL